MSEFLLLGSRSRATGIPPPADEVSPRRAARDFVATASWHQCLRRWGLLRSFALPADLPGTDATSTVLACLIVQASGDTAAARLAAGWGRVTGYQVSVLRLRAWAP